MLELNLTRADGTCKALVAVCGAPIYGRRYHDFLIGMVYGEKLGFDTRLTYVMTLAERMLR